MRKKCPFCGANLEEHGTNPGDHHWWFCRECGVVIDDKQKEEKA